MTNPDATDEQFRALAIERFPDDEIIIDDDATVSRNQAEGGDHGVYVQAWVWVPNPEMEEAR